MPTAVEPFVPSRHVPYEDLPLDDPPRELSCGGDFADPQLNAEMRRFLWRDIVRFVSYATNAVTFVIVIAVAFQSDAPVSTNTIVAVGPCVVCSAIEAIFFFPRWLAREPYTPLVRIAASVLMNAATEGARVDAGGAFAEA